MLDGEQASGTSTQISGSDGSAETVGPLETEGIEDGSGKLGAFEGCTLAEGPGDTVGAHSSGNRTHRTESGIISTDGDPDGSSEGIFDVVGAELLEGSSDGCKDRVGLLDELGVSVGMLLADGMNSETKEGI